MLDFISCIVRHARHNYVKSRKENVFEQDWHLLEVDSPFVMKFFTARLAESSHFYAEEIIIIHGRPPIFN